MYLKLLAFVCCMVGIVYFAQAQKTPTSKPKNTVANTQASANKNVVKITSEKDLEKYAKQLQADSAQADNDAAELLDSLNKTFSEEQAEVDDLDRQAEQLLEWYGTVGDENVASTPSKSAPKPAPTPSKSTNTAITRTTVVRRTHQ